MSILTAVPIAWPGEPANDNVPVRGPRPGVSPDNVIHLPKNRWKWRRPLPFPPLIPSVLTVPLELADYYDDWVQYKNPNPFKVSPPWVFHADCGRSPGSPPYRPGGNPNDGAWIERVASTVHNCDAGQVPAGTRARVVPYEDMLIPEHTGRTMFLSDSALTPALRMRHDKSWWRPLGSSAVGSTFKHVPVSPAPYSYAPIPGAPWTGLPTNPNPLRRNQPGRFPRPAQPDPASLPQPLPPAEWQWSSNPRGRPLPRPHVRASPPRGVRERKFISRGARIGIFLWNAMDNFSELSEIGGSLYEALPQDVKDRWNCGSGINIGQYGTDITECHVRALWHNWHRLNGDVAIREIAKNIVEDMTIGAFHKAIAKMLPRGISLEKTAVSNALAKADPEAYIAMRLKEVFELLGV